MFTGDIEDNAKKKRIYERYLNADGKDKGYKIDLLKLPHHGAYKEHCMHFCGHLNRIM